MYRRQATQLAFENFYLPFGGRLRSDNRWVRLAKLIPWTAFESGYAASLADSGMGCPAKSVRIALGALIIKERLGTGDEETVAQIQENPYLQYFLGFHEYRDEPPFDPSMFVHFRKRLGADIVMTVNERIAQLAVSQASSPARSLSEADPPSSPAGDCAAGSETRPVPPSEVSVPEAPSPEEPDTEASESSDSASANQGKLIVDATCAPADIAYPTDLNLLNEARETAEQIIDVLHDPLKGRVSKPRTYRQQARKAYLSAAKARRLSSVSCFYRPANTGNCSSFMRCIVNNRRCLSNAVTALRDALSACRSPIFVRLSEGRPKRRANSGPKCQ